MTAGTQFFLLLVAGLATARVTRLIVQDEITAPLRRLAHRLDKNSQHIGAVVICQYCAGVWAAAGVLGLLAVAVESSGWGQWLAGAPVAIMAIAQAGFWLAPQAPVSPDAAAYEAAPWPESKGD